ncbi:hypothetical protein V7O62_04140 [Methanolobus sp. ZRKC2]|uniref:hypothetical protein n=1 Tax=Methanolobus sp. ZRKC2 TaxID=3125783 RepID=UPI0032565A0F
MMKSNATLFSLIDTMENNHSKLSLIFSLVLLTLMCGNAHAIVYTADPGDDLASIVANLSSGDVLNLNPGIYNDHLVFSSSNSGINGNPITINGNQQVTFDGVDYTGKGIVLDNNASFVVFNGINVTGYDYCVQNLVCNNIKWNNCDIWLNESGVRDDGFGHTPFYFGPGAQNCSLINSKLHDVRNSANCINIIGTMENPTTDITIYNCEIYDIYWHDAICFQNDGGGVEVWDEQVILRINISNNIIHDIGEQYAVPITTNSASVWNSIIANNYLYNVEKYISISGGDNYYYNNTIKQLYSDNYIGQHQSYSTPNNIRDVFEGNHAPIRLIGGSPGTETINPLYGVQIYKNSTGAIVRDWNGTQRISLAHNSSVTIKHKGIFELNFVSGSGDYTQGTPICYDNMCSASIELSSDAIKRWDATMYPIHPTGNNGNARVVVI